MSIYEDPRAVDTLVDEILVEEAAKQEAIRNHTKALAKELGQIRDDHVRNAIMLLSRLMDLKLS